MVLSVGDLKKRKRKKKLWLQCYVKCTIVFLCSMTEKIYKYFLVF